MADPYFTIRVMCTLGLRGVMTEIEPLLAPAHDAYYAP